MPAPAAPAASATQPEAEAAKTGFAVRIRNQNIVTFTTQRNNENGVKL